MRRLGDPGTRRAARSPCLQGLAGIAAGADIRGLAARRRRCGRWQLPPAACRRRGRKPARRRSPGDGPAPAQGLRPARRAPAPARRSTSCARSGSARSARAASATAPASGGRCSRKPAATAAGSCARRRPAPSCPPTCATASPSAPTPAPPCAPSPARAASSPPASTRSRPAGTPSRARRWRGRWRRWRPNRPPRLAPPRAARRLPGRLVRAARPRLRRGPSRRRGALRRRRAAGALRRLRRDLEDLGIPLASVPAAGLRRLDVAADLGTDSATEGLALLECLGAASPGAGNIAAYRAERCVESVLIKSRAGRTLARVYDKGAETGAASRAGAGCASRPSGACRARRGSTPPRSTRRSCAIASSAASRRLWQAAGGFRLGGLEAVGERLAAAVASGQLAPSRARSIAGYLVLRSAGVPRAPSAPPPSSSASAASSASRSRCWRRPGSSVDFATVIDECLGPAGVAVVAACAPPPEWERSF